MKIAEIMVMVLHHNEQAVLCAVKRSGTVRSGKEMLDKSHAEYPGNHPDACCIPTSAA